MAVYYSIRCPHCNGLVESGKNRTGQYGSPFRTCQHCGKTYIDNNYVEAGLFDEEEIKKRAFSWQSIVWALIGGAMLLIGIVESVVGLIILGAVLAGISIYSIVYNLRYTPSNDKELQSELVRSKQRLADPQYVIALWKANCQVTSELVEWAKKETGYKDKTNMIKEGIKDDDDYDASRYICQSLKFLSDVGTGKCLICFRTAELKRYKIKNEMGTREIPICDKCVDRFKKHNSNI